MKKVILVICISIIALTGCFGKVKPKTTVDKESSSAEQTNKQDKDTENYDDIVKKAKELNLNGKFKDSELKLATIPVSVLSNDKNVTLKKIVETLSKSNNDGIQKENENQKSEQKANQISPDSSDNSSMSFTGDLAK